MAENQLKKLSDDELDQQLIELGEERRRREHRRKAKIVRAQEAAFRGVRAIPNVDFLRPIRVAVPVILDAEVDWMDVGGSLEPAIRLHSNPEYLVRKAVWGTYRRMILKTVNRVRAYAREHNLLFSEVTNFLPEKVRRVTFPNLIEKASSKKTQKRKR